MKPDASDVPYLVKALETIEELGGSADRISCQNAARVAREAIWDQYRREIWRDGEKRPILSAD